MFSPKGIGLTILIAATLGVAYYLSRPAYPKISPKAYQYATALYAVCNQQAHEKLDPLNELIEASHSESEINLPESRWLQAIIEQARDGQWQKAVAECRVLLDCQVDKDIELPTADGSALSVAQ